MPKFASEEAACRDIEIDTICADLGEVYFIEKDAKNEREKLRLVFFEAITASLEDSDLATKTVPIPDDIDNENVQAYVLKYHPGWTLESFAGSKALVKEDPALQPYTKVVRMDPWLVPAPTKDDPKAEKEVFGYVIQRSIVNGSALLDEERLEALDPELYYQVTAYPAWTELIPDPDGSGIADIMEWAGIKRQLLGDLTPDEYEALKPYTYEGPKTIKLLVRYAKADESE